MIKIAVVLICMCISGAAFPALADSNHSLTVTSSAIAKFSPRARLDIVNAILAKWDLAERAEINTPLRLQHFFAQIATETGGLRLLEENLNYSEARMLVVFKRRVTPADAKRLAGDPVALANHVYNNRLGNRLPMDGWNYRGSGLMQLTGRENFSKRGKELSLPLEEKPDLARSTDMALDAAVAYWTFSKINAAADADDLQTVRLLVNGGQNGLPEARIWLARAKRVFSAPGSAAASAASSEESMAVKEVLRELDFLKTSPDAAPQLNQVADALKAFQASRGLEQTGFVDDSTLYELTDPDNFKEFQ
ncbi:putative chitinase [Peteryoungia aggregata LMG 23059]|uniref:Chitinase n=1 Tax=Peteryoungia aggregata LMG 23059 TaxID=1368425 RepID=A0ABU0G6H9_9HYPH|nr:peptidoglycan-binding protein [Peteryoungia aggregata]MDQ0420927.1 putative chitinase [Peteryoungia aggregata LMG 23059]